MISEAFVLNGAAVYITARDATSCEKAVTELNALGKGKAFAIPADFYKESDLRDMVMQLMKRESRKLIQCGFGSNEKLMTKKGLTCLSTMQGQTGRRLTRISPRPVGRES